MSWLEPYQGGQLKEDTTVEALEGFRAWRVFMGVAPLRLHSYYFSDVIWEPRKKMVASCASNKACSHNGVCDGGIYALKNYDLSPYFTTDCEYTALGKVYLWGRVLECENGYRAEFAYPSGFYDTSSNSAILAKIYGVPLLVDPRPKPDTSLDMFDDNDILWI